MTLCLSLAKYVLCPLASKHTRYQTVGSNCAWSISIADPCAGRAALLLAVGGASRLCSFTSISSTPAGGPSHVAVSSKSVPSWLELLVIRILSFSQHRTVPYICHQNSFFCFGRDIFLRQQFQGNREITMVEKTEMCKGGHLWILIHTEVPSLGWSNHHDFHRGRSQRRRFPVMRSPVPGTWTCYRLARHWRTNPCRCRRHTEKPWILVAPLPVNFAGATLPRNGPFVATVLMLPSGRTLVFSLSISTLI